MAGFQLSTNGSVSDLEGDGSTYLGDALLIGSVVLLCTVGPLVRLTAPDAGRRLVRNLLFVSAVVAALIAPVDLWVGDINPHLRNRWIAFFVAWAVFAMVSGSVAAPGTRGYRIAAGVSWIACAGFALAGLTLAVLGMEGPVIIFGLFALGLSVAFGLVARSLGRRARVTTDPSAP